MGPIQYRYVYTIYIYIYMYNPIPIRTFLQVHNAIRPSDAVFPMGLRVPCLKNHARTEGIAKLGLVVVLACLGLEPPG